MNAETRGRKDAKQLAEIEALREITVTLIKNPVISLVGGVVVLSALHKAKVVDSITAGLTAASLVPICSLQALAPVAPLLGEALGKLLPAIPGIGI